MARRNDRPDPAPPDPADGDTARTARADGARAELRRRLESLPASHPSSPWYRDAPRQRLDVTETAGQAAAAAASAVRGDNDKQPRPADEKLWLRAAAQHAAAQARRQARHDGVPPPIAPASREPFRPWFAASADVELWLNTDGTGEPWFTRPSEP
jgi:hypothetical protein